MVDSSGIPVGFLKDKKVASPKKCSYKVNLNFHHRAVDIYYLRRDVIIEIRFFSLRDKCGNISTTVIDINCTIGENVDITFAYLFMLNIFQ